MLNAGRRILAIVLANALSAIFAQAQNSQPNPYETVENFFKLPPGRTIGSTAGIHIDRDGSSLWVFDRCGANACVGSNVAPVLEFDASGTLVKSFGAGMFIRPHGIHVDPEGNVWVTDGEGPDGKDPNRNGKGHQVFKFSRDGKVLMTLGKAGIAGTGPDTFNQPSQVLVAPNGDIFVGDGHGGNSNARIVKFSKDGNSSRRGAGKERPPGSSKRPTLSAWIPEVVCSLPIGETTASSSLTRKERFSRNGSNSAGRAGSSSTGTTLSL
jgi:sugar lactone lactonase YvrE